MNTPTSSTPISDFANARHFITAHGSHLRYVPAWGWLFWDGKRWQYDAADLHVTHLARQILLSLHDEADLKISHLRSLLSIARCDPAIVTTRAAFDANPLLLNANNGTINLQTRELLPHNPLDLLTRLIPVDYNPHAVSQHWDGFLDHVTCHDTNLAAYLQRAIGYTLSATTVEQFSFVLLGKGHNGKRTFLNALSYTLGDYAHFTPLSTFTDHPSTTALTSLPAVRFVTSILTESARALKLSTVTHLTARDPIAITAARVPFTFQPQFVTWLTATHIPAMHEDNAAFWHHLKFLPFTVDMTGSEDRTLPAKLRKDAQAILAWAVQGHFLWQETGLHEPNCVTQATTTAREEQDLIADFIKDCCTNEDDDHTIKALDLYHAYLAWCRELRLRPDSSTAFFLSIQKRGYRRERKSAGKIYHGLVLKPAPVTIVPHVSHLTPLPGQPAPQSNASMPPMPGMPPLPTHSKKSHQPTSYHPSEYDNHDPNIPNLSPEELVAIYRHYGMNP